MLLFVLVWWYALYGFSDFWSVFGVGFFHSFVRIEV